MSVLVLDLRPGDWLRINGADLSFECGGRVALMSRPDFMFGRQLMTWREDMVPLERLYFAIQEAYVGPPPQRGSWLLQAAEEIRAVAEPSAHNALACAMAGQFNAALKTLRALLRASAQLVA